MTLEPIIPILAGWITGWIVNYFSDVLPVTRRFSKPACPRCGSSLSLTSYLLFQRCHNGHGRSFRLWLVQAAVTAMSIYIFLQPPVKIDYWAGMILLVYFGVVFVIDMEHKLILHPTSIVGSILAMTLGTLRNGLGETLLGGLTGFLVMLGFYFFGVLFAKIRARRMKAQGMESDDEEALGQGDVILVTILGFLVGGPVMTLFMIVISILLGGLVSLLLILGLIVSRKYNENALMVFIPFGPYFLVGAALILFFPDALKTIIPA
jgi:hypothetical protein